ncbi:MAG: hypothetical protein ACT7A5_23365, partial [Ferrovibrionaceae bacterium]
AQASGTSVDRTAATATAETAIAGNHGVSVMRSSGAKDATAAIAASQVGAHRPVGADAAAAAVGTKGRSAIAADGGC